MNQDFLAPVIENDNHLSFFFMIYSTHSKKYPNLWTHAPDSRGSSVAHTEILTYVALYTALSFIEDTRNAKN